MEELSFNSIPHLLTFGHTIGFMVAEGEDEHVIRLGRPISTKVLSLQFLATRILKSVEKRYEPSELAYPKVPKYVENRLRRQSAYF